MEEIVKLEIISPLQTQMFDIEWVEIQAPHGSFVIGYGHNDLTSLLKRQGKLTFKKMTGFEQSVVVSGGVVTIFDNKVIVILEK
jgi:F0F1-type ATP synthase epsilon subunit